MAAGIVEALKFSDPESPHHAYFVKTFSANALTSTTATQADYPTIPEGYMGVFAGFSADNSALLLSRFTSNASGSETVLGTRNVASALSDRDCRIRVSFLSTDYIHSVN